LTGSGRTGGMVDRSRTAAVVRAVLIESWPDRFPEGALVDEDVPLGEGGLELDSIDTVEFLLACEDELGGRFTGDLLAGGPLMLRGVVDHFARA
jgi:acyl carrier protein